jgi:hypothetical protein
MNDDIRSLRTKIELLEMRVLTLEVYTDSLRLNREVGKASGASPGTAGVVPLDAIAHAAQVAVDLSERLSTYVKERVGCAACAPARRPENTQSASDSPLT